MLRALRVNPRGNPAKLEPFADWVPPRHRYVGKVEGPHPAFRSPKKGIVVIWDAVTPMGDAVAHSPDEPMVRFGATYTFQGLFGGRDEDGEVIPYMTELPAGATQRDVIGHILAALDAYPYAEKMPPALFHGVQKLRSAPYGEINMSWGAAPAEWLRPR